MSVTVDPTRSGSATRIWKRRFWAASSTSPARAERSPVPITKSTWGARRRISSARAWAMQPATPTMISGRSSFSSAISPSELKALSSGFWRTEQVFRTTTEASRREAAGTRPMDWR